jgi:hypothetical protein
MSALLHSHVPLRILSNSRSSNNICLHVTIKVSLESKYDAKDELIQYTGAKVMRLMIQRHLPFVSHLSIENFQTAVTQRVRTPTTQ